MNGKAQMIVEGAEIPSVPYVLQEILALASDPGSSGCQLEEKIQTEPGLVSHLLKTVNSGYHSLPRKVTSIRHAIALLGFTTVKSIASGLALIDAFNNLSSLNRQYVLTIWNQSLTSAGLTKVLAGSRPRDKQDELFLAAMIHNVGHLVLAEYYESEYAALTKTDPFPSVEEERECFGVDHAEVGAAMLEAWQFADEVTHLVESHHEHGSFEGDETDILCLGVCESLPRTIENLARFLEKSETEVDVDILEMLSKLNWQWEDLQRNEGLISRSIETTQQIMC
ncbi:MAG: HDOD domain-containing protein [Nitrospina sp.]|jgi:HD-like signal output (HDOD) protein|nr:HDOD domain-containing protein [Nitrospina sp.]